MRSLVTRSLACVAIATLAVPALADHTKPDPQMQAVLDALAKLGPKPLETLTPEEARKQPGPPDAVKAVLKAKGKGTDPEPVGGVKDVKFMSGKVELPARVYTPKGDGPFPVLVYWHGGGFVIADIDAYDASCRALCNAANCLVVSCEYRHAPEHPHPAQGEDAFAAYQWVLKNAADWKGDTKRVAVGGESAGGNLAANVSIMARDKKVQAPVYQLLVYPVTDNNLDTDSYKAYADAKPLNMAMMKWFFAHTLGNQTPGQVKSAFPLKAVLTGLPPATVITAEIDPLRDDGKNYADALTKAGVKVAHKNFEGVTHEFFGMGAVVDKGKEAVAFAAEGLKTGFGK